MSICDIISSLFVALGTIMMPSDSIYQLAGPMLGNQVTCQIRGWLTLFGLIGTTASNACLSVYFVLKIVFKLDVTKIRKRIEPIMYAYSVALACFVPSYFLSNDLIHPNPYDGVCNVIPYPESCDEQKWYDFSRCVWDQDMLEEFDSSMIVMVGILSAHFAFIVISMSVVLWKAAMINREIKMLETTLKAMEQNDSPDLNAPGAVVPSINGVSSHDDMLGFMDDLCYNRCLTFQALMYVGAYMLTWMWTFGSTTLHIANLGLDIVESVLFPLQGFWNLFIFLYDKAYLLRQSDESLSFSESIKKILSSPSDLPSLVLTNIPMMALTHQSRTTPKIDSSPQPNSDNVIPEMSFVSVDVENDSLFNSVSKFLKGDFNSNVESSVRKS